MHNKLYSEGAHDDSIIITALIEEAIPETIDVLFVYLKDGVNATIHLKPPHNASWNITWQRNNPNRLDTGDEIDPSPCLADPQCIDILTEQFKRIYTKLYQFCDCSECRPS